MPNNNFEYMCRRPWKWCQKMLPEYNWRTISGPDWYWNDLQCTQDQDSLRKCQTYRYKTVLTWATMDLIALSVPKFVLQWCEPNWNIRIDKKLSSQWQPDALIHFYMNGLFDMFCCWHFADDDKYFFVRLKWNYISGQVFVC